MHFCNRFSLMMLVASVLFYIPSSYGQAACPSPSGSTITVNGAVSTCTLSAGDSLIVNAPTGQITATSSSQGGVIVGAVSGAISNAGTIQDFGNSENGIYISGGSITSLTNSGTIITGTGQAAIFNYGEIGQNIGGVPSGGINNSGLIQGAQYAINNGGYSNGWISEIINTGTIAAGSSGAINNWGTIHKITNYGQVSSVNGSAIYNISYDIWGIPGGLISNIENMSGATISGVSAGVLNFAGNITEIANSGTISGSGTASGIGIANGSNNIAPGSIASITNLTGGLITGDYAGIANEGTVAGTPPIGPSTISSITNQSGAIISGTNSSIGVGIGNDGTITNITNSGTITGKDIGISNTGTLTALTNNTGGVISGTATANASGVVNGVNASTTNQIVTITNFGSIVGNGSGYGIDNTYGTIGTLNNAQGSSAPLTYKGNLPANYNIILGANPTTYGKLSYLGGGATTLANFGIYGGTVSSRIYSGVLSGVTAVTSGASGAYSGQAYVLQLSSGSSSIWDLLFPNWAPPVTGPDATNTLASIQINTGGLASMYNQQTAAYNAALSYDCSVYDENNLCVSAGGRYTYASPSATNAQAGLVIVGYRPVPTFRFGAFADQSVNISTPTNLSQSKSSPMWGMFAKWNLNKDGTGLGVQASAVTSSSTLTVSRAQLANTEAGSGNTQFDGQGYQLSTSYHQPVTDAMALVPYLGLRYTRVNAGAYTESSSATVTAPLSYNAMAQNNFSAIGGIGIRSLLAEKLTGTASVGIQQSLKYSMANYQGTSAISGIENFSVQMPGSNNSMATATAGLAYDINKRERLGFNVLWQQQPFINTNTTTALATYTMGF